MLTTTASSRDASPSILLTCALESVDAQGLQTSGSSSRAYPEHRYYEGQYYTLSFHTYLASDASLGPEKPLSLLPR